jgi:hypothetical protein
MWLKKEREGDEKERKKSASRSSRMAKYEERKDGQRTEEEDEVKIGLYMRYTKPQSPFFFISIFVNATRRIAFRWAIVLSFFHLRQVRGRIRTLLQTLFRPRSGQKYHSEAKLFDPSRSEQATQVAFEPLEIEGET